MIGDHNVHGGLKKTHYPENSLTQFSAPRILKSRDALFPRALRFFIFGGKIRFCIHRYASFTSGLGN